LYASALAPYNVRETRRSEVIRLDFGDANTEAF
jgi:hypothetical protein